MKTEINTELYMSQKSLELEKTRHIPGCLSIAVAGAATLNHATALLDAQRWLDEGHGSGPQDQEQQ